MSGDEAISVFKDQWNIYQWVIDNNLMGHRELLAFAKSFIHSRYKGLPVTMADFGCGNSLLIPEITRSVQLDHYFGIDLAENALSMAQQQLKNNSIRHRQFCQDLFLGMPETPESPNLIYSAFAVHHGDEQEKRQFFSRLYQQFDGECSFVLADTMMHKDQEFSDYVTMVEQYFIEQGVSPDWLTYIMAHLRRYDHPETEENWLDIVRSSGWTVAHKQSLGSNKGFPAILMVLER